MISIVIPAYKNTDKLVSNLNHNIQFFKDCEIIIVNDDPSTSIKESLKNFPQIILIENKDNLGFGSTVNAGVKISKNPFVFLLNSDVILSDDSFKKTTSRFQQDPHLFAVSFAQKEKNGQFVGKNRIFFHRGLVQHSRANDFTLGINGWAEGGTCIVDKSKFEELGGFDNLYAPFYWEDIDLSYNAWKSGYNILFDPTVVVEHHHESTIGKYFDSKHVKTISYRNQILFTWKNISGKKYCVLHILYLPVLKIAMLLKGDISFFNGLFQAVLKVPQLMSSRLKIQKHWKLHDEEIFRRFT